MNHAQSEIINQAFANQQRVIWVEFFFIIGEMPGDDAADFAAFFLAGNRADGEQVFNGFTKYTLL